MLLKAPKVEMVAYADVSILGSPDPKIRVHNSLLPAGLAYLMSDTISVSSTPYIKFGTNNTPNAPGMTGLQAIISANNYAQDGRATYVEVKSYVDNGNGTSTSKITYNVVTGMGKVLGEVGELGLDFARTDDAVVHTRLALATKLNVTAENQIRVEYTFEMTYPNTPLVETIDMDIDGVITQITATHTLVNLSIMEPVFLMCHCLIADNNWRVTGSVPTDKTAYQTMVTTTPVKTTEVAGKLSVVNVTFHLQDCNYVGGIKHVQYGYNSKPFASVQFSTPIPKDNTKELELKFTKDFSGFPVL